MSGSESPAFEQGGHWATQTRESHYSYPSPPLRHSANPSRSRTLHITKLYSQTMPLNVIVNRQPSRNTSTRTLESVSVSERSAALLETLDDLPRYKDSREGRVASAEAFAEGLDVGSDLLIGIHFVSSFSLALSGRPRSGRTILPLVGPSFSPSLPPVRLSSLSLPPVDIIHPRVKFSSPSSSTHNLIQHKKHPIPLTNALHGPQVPRNEGYASRSRTDDWFGEECRDAVCAELVDFRVELGGESGDVFRGGFAGVLEAVRVAGGYGVEVGGEEGLVEFAAGEVTAEGEGWVLVCLILWVVRRLWKSRGVGSVVSIALARWESGTESPAQGCRLRTELRSWLNSGMASESTPDLLTDSRARPLPCIKTISLRSCRLAEVRAGPRRGYELISGSISGLISGQSLRTSFGLIPS